MKDKLKKGKDKITDVYEGYRHYILPTLMMVGFLALLAFCGKVEAHDDIVIHEHTTNVTNHVNRVDENALSMAAAQHQFYGGTLDLQLSIASGVVEDKKAISFAFAQKPCKTCPLFNGSMATDGTHFGYGAAVNFRF